MNNIDWSKAPDFYNYHLQNKADESSFGFCHYGEGTYYFEDGSKTSYVEAWIISHRPTPTPEPLIYTQAMADAGEQVKIGMECLIVFLGNQTAQIGSLIVITNEYIIMKIGEGEQHYSRSSYELRGIDPRSDTEKAIDDLIDAHGGGAEVTLSLIKQGKIHGVTFSGKN